MLVILILGTGLLPGAEAPSLPIPTHENISYGPHARNTLDFWQAKGDGPRPLLVYIHGGGWLTGDKSKKGPAFKPFLDKGDFVCGIQLPVDTGTPVACSGARCRTRHPVFAVQRQGLEYQYKSNCVNRAQCGGLHFHVVVAA